jgi:hypothetical protein
MIRRIGSTWGSSPFAAAIAVWLCSTQAVAQSDANVSTAREIAKEGLNAYDAGRYEEANDKLSRALEVVGVPTLALFTARANVKIGRLVRASELYLLATRLNPKGASEIVQLQAQRDAERERAELLPRIPRLTVVLEGAKSADVDLTVDGQPVAKSLLGTAQLVDPGDHLVVARRGSEEVRGELQIAEREVKTTTLTFGSPRNDGQVDRQTGKVVTTMNNPDAAFSMQQGRGGASRGSAQSTAGWVGVGLGGAGLLLGAGVGTWLLVERSRLRDEGCSGESCYTEQSSDVDKFNTLRTISLVGFVAGTALTATGVTLLLTAPRGESTASTAVVLGPGFASVEGSF